VAIFLAGAVGLYFAQHKGWSYHQMPAIGSLALLLALLPASLPLGRIRSKIAVGVVGTLVPLAAGLVAIDETTTFRAPLVERVVPDEGFSPIIRRYTRRREPVLFVSTSVTPAYPLLLQLDRRPGSRYLWFFPIAMVSRESRIARPVDARDNDWLAAQERRFLSELADDIKVRLAPVIFVDSANACHGCPIPFSVFEYLQRHGALDFVMRNYTRQPDIAQFAVFVANARLTPARTFPNRGGTW
jgi:hypothetical protein